MIRFKNNYFLWDEEFLDKCVKKFNEEVELKFNTAYGEFKIMKPPISPRTPKADKPETAGWEGAD